MKTMHGVLRDIYEHTILECETDMTVDEMRGVLCRSFNMQSGNFKERFLYGSKVTCCSDRTSELSVKDMAKFIDWLIMEFGQRGVIFKTFGDIAWH